MKRTAGETRRRLFTSAALAGALALCAGATRAPAEEAFQCSARDVQGVAAADAETAVRLVCAELRRESGARGRFEVSLGTLGRVVILGAERLAPPASVTVRLDGIEEVDVAAPRVARALVHGEPIASTQRVDNLLKSETRLAPSKKGSVKFGASIADVETPGFGARANGFSLGLQYATPRFSLPLEMRFAWDDDDYPAPDKGVDLFSISIGGRAFLSTRSVSPFVGAGIGTLWLSADESEGGHQDYQSFYADETVVAPYVEVGVEALRLHRGRVALVVRADLPLTSLERPEMIYPGYDPRTGQPTGRDTVIPAESRYVAPVWIGLSVAF